MKPTSRLRRTARLTTVLTAVAITLAACGSSTSAKGPARTGPGGNAQGNTTTQGNTRAVLPVSSNPIKNSSTIQALKIDSVLVENNIDPLTKKIADDHLEIGLSNTSTTDLKNIEIYYTFRDPKTKATENYYTKLPLTFTVPAKGRRIVHFDNTGATNHFPDNKFSLYHTNQNAMDVTVVVSAEGAATQITNLKKDAGGPEAKD